MQTLDLSGILLGIAGVLAAIFGIRFLLRFLGGGDDN